MDATQTQPAAIPRFPANSLPLLVASIFVTERIFV
jgi:hypothetical protein